MSQEYPKELKPEETCVEPISLIDLPIPRLGPSRSVVLATEYLVIVVEEDMQLSNGPTALYWELIRVIGRHTDSRA